VQYFIVFCIIAWFTLWYSERRINVRFFNSHVDHITTGEREYVEGHANHMSGTLVNGDLIFAGTNSHGDPTYMKGHAKLFGRVFVLWGYFHGYKKYPNGRFIAAMAWKGDKKITMVAPSSLRELLLVSVDYEEI